MEELISKGTRIDLPFPSLRHRKVVEFKECNLMLFETHIKYKVVCDYLGEDNDTGIEKLFKSNYRYTRKRNNLVDVSMYYDNPEEKWVVSTEFWEPKIKLLGGLILLKKPSLHILN